MASSNPNKIDPPADSQATNVHSHIANVEQPSGTGASSTSLAPPGKSTTNTSTSLKGSGLIQPQAGVDTSDTLLKNPRKQDGPAHSTQAGSALHGSGDRHMS